MNIAIVSSLSVYHQLAQVFAKEDNVDNVYHYGSHSSVVESGKYKPYAMDVPIIGNVDDKLTEIFADLENKKIDFLLASGAAVPSSELAHSRLQELKIPYFFPKPKLTNLEKNRTQTKKILNSLNIPTGEGETVDGKYLFENFKSIPRPFVVKQNFAFQYGRQTVIVSDDNFEDVYLDLFSVRLDQPPRITNINFDARLVIETFIKVKREYSYHILINSTGWKYLGSARDYKKVNDGDIGFNCLSMGSYNISDVDPRVHGYADKIVKFLIEKGFPYKGIMFLGIAVDENDVPYILEINPEVDVFLVPRVNTVEGLTQEHIRQWRWMVNEKGWVNFPDYQWRIYRNTPNIKWKNKVHEVLEGHKTSTLLPAEEEYCLYHPKTIDRQERQNNYYDTL
jgi:phosphoribosylamine-glycine ligase